MRTPSQEVSAPRFEQVYWRTAPALTEKLEPLSSNEINADQFRLLADHVPTLCWIANGDGYIVWYNRRWHEYCGTSPDLMEGWGWQSVHDPDVLPEVMERWQSSIATGEPFEMTFPLRGADGHFRPFLTRVQPLRGPDGEVVRWFGVNTEISATIAAQEALQESENRLRIVQAAGGIGSFDYNLRTEVAVCSPEYFDIMGLPQGSSITLESGKTLIHPDDIETVLANFNRAIAERESFKNEYRIIRQDNGETRWVANNAVMMFDENGNPSRYIGGVIDITDRIKATEALAQSETRLRAILDAAPGGFYCVDTDGNTNLVSQGFLDMMGFASEKEVIGRKLHDAIHHTHPDGRPYPVEDCPIYGCASTGRPAHISSELFFRVDGTSVPVEYWVAPIEQDGEHVGAICTILDLTQRHALEAAHRETEERYRLAARATNDAIWDWDLTSNEVAWSEALFEVFGYAPDEVSLTADWWSKQLHPDDRDRVSKGIHEVIDGAMSHWQDEYRFCSADGTYRHVLDRGFVLRRADGSAVRMIGAMLDQTTRLRAEIALRELNEHLEDRVQAEMDLRSQTEEALRQSQKMETVGQLTGGIAHDFNNLLQIVSGNLELLSQKLSPDVPEIKRYAERAMIGASRASTLTQRLLAFSRRQPLDPKATSINRLIPGMSELLHRTLGETIEMEAVLAPRLWTVQVDQNQLENAIINLAVNARDAMPEGGKLTIETANTHLDRSYVAQHPELAPGQYVVVCISDTGSGMDRETVGKAVEPFFTTKEVGKGTGLGLSMVYGFIKQSGGHLRIYSEVGEGTTVKMYFPRATEEAVVELETLQLNAQGGRNELILICEDDEDVRAYTAEVLRDLGYRILEAADGPSALRLLAEHRGQVDLLFTDVVLPGGMTGAVLAKEAQSLQPRLRTLFTTGYARNAIVHHGRLDPGVELLTKPFSYADLAARVREILDRPDEQS